MLGQNDIFLNDEFKFSNYLSQIHKLHIVLFKLEMMEEKNTHTKK
jgi:hypothetical protein